MNDGWLSVDLLTSGECDLLVDALRGAGGGHAPVYGAGAQPAVQPSRRTTRLFPTPDARSSVFDTFEGVRERLCEHFRVPLANFEEPQFLLYKEGDYFVAHQDGNTPAIFDDSRHRRVSLILFLSDPASYSGADLRFHTSFTERVTIPATRGTAVAFRSELTHEVTPLVAGERYTVVTWYRIADGQASSDSQQ